MKGKDAEFTCTVKKIVRTELDELNDEYAQDHSEFDTLDEYKADLKKQITERKEKEAKQARKDNGVSKAASNATIEIPEAMLDTRADEMVQNFARRLQAQGMSLEQYMKYTGADVNQMRAQVKPQAEIQIRNELVLEKIAETEKIEVTDEDVNKEIENMAKAYNMKVEDISKLIDDEQKESIRKELAVQKAADLIADNAVEVEKKEEEAAPAEEKKEEE